MTKRITALLLAFALLAALMPTALAWDEDVGLEKLPIMAWQEEYRVLEVYRTGNDLLMSASDLSWLSDFQSTFSGTVYQFSRGSKTVCVSTSTQIIYLKGAAQGLYLDSACREIDGIWYLSAASVLPWLNVRCTVLDGALIAVPNTVSLWDSISSFRLTDYSFELSKVCSTIGISSTLLETEAFIKNNGLAGLAYLVPDAQNSSLGEELAYYSLLCDMIEDVSATDQAVNTWLEKYGDTGDALEAVGTGVSFLNEEMGDAFDTDTITYTKNALGILAYCALFDQDGESKVEILQTLVNGADAASNSGMISAAVDVIQDYTDFWEGIFNKVKHDTVNGVMGEIGSGTVLSLLGYAVKTASGYAEQVDRISLYENLMAEALDGYRCYSGETTLLQLESYVNFIILYLYASEQCYRAIADYMEDKGKGSVSTLNEYVSMADAAEKAQGEFINISMLLEDDCSDFGLKRDGAEEYKELFRELDTGLVPGGVTAAAEQAVFWAALDEMELQNTAWDVCDADGDGENELFVMCGDVNAEQPSFIVIDPNDYVMGSYTADASAETDELRRDSSGRYYIHRIYDGGTGYTENALLWQDGHYQELPVGTASERAVLPSPELTEQDISGDTKELLAQLDNYFLWREDCQVYPVELNGDSSNDRVYIMLDAVNYWTDRCEPAGSTGGESHLSFADDRITVLTAETQSGGVRLRVCRVDAPDISRYDIFTGDIKLEYDKKEHILYFNDCAYKYQSSGEPFVGEKLSGELAVAELLGMTPDEVCAVMDEYYENGEPQLGTAYGDFRGLLLTLTFTESWGLPKESSVLAEVSAMPWNEERTLIVDSAYSDMNMAELFMNVKGCKSWSELQPVGNDGAVFFYETYGVYSHANGNSYGVTAAFYGDTPDSELAYVTFTLLAESNSIQE